MAATPRRAPRALAEQRVEAVLRVRVGELAVDGRQLGLQRGAARGRAGRVARHERRAVAAGRRQPRALGLQLRGLLSARAPAEGSAAGSQQAPALRWIPASRGWPGARSCVVSPQSGVKL